MGYEEEREIKRQKTLKASRDSHARRESIRACDCGCVAFFFINTSVEYRKETRKEDVLQCTACQKIHRIQPCSTAGLRSILK